MNKEVVKKGYDLAQKEVEEKQIEKVKDIVKGTLSKIKDIEKDIDDYKEKIKELEETRKILRLDIDDLKEGHLDRIEERQKTDKKAKKISVVIVEKEVHHHHYDWWHTPYKITYVPYYPPATVQPFIPHNPFYGTLTCNTNNVDVLSLKLGGANTASFGTTTSNASNAVFTVNSSVVKNNVIGTYSIGDKTVHLR